MSNFKRGSLVTLLLVSIVSTVSCSNGGAEQGSEGGHTGPTLDLDVAMLTSRGCLDLEGTVTAMRALPESVRMRKHTEDFDLQKTDSGSLRRNFQALVAFSNFTFAERSLADSLDDFPMIRQEECKTLTIESDVEGRRDFEIVKTSDTSGLKIELDDGSSMLWRLKDGRQLEIQTVTTVMDPCPNYTTARATTTILHRWGTASELESIAPQVSRSYIQTLSKALNEVPDEIGDLASYESNDLVMASPSGLRSLMASPVDTDILHCPYRAKPPTGDEPPAPTE